MPIHKKDADDRWGKWLEDVYRRGREQTRRNIVIGKLLSEDEKRDMGDSDYDIEVHVKSATTYLDAERTIAWFSESPETGEPDCFCSYCKLLIEGQIFRAWRDIAGLTYEARFHPHCFIEVRDRLDQIAIDDSAMHRLNPAGVDIFAGDEK